MPRWTLKWHCKKIYAAACAGNPEALSDLRALSNRIMRERHNRSHQARKYGRKVKGLLTNGNVPCASFT